MLSDSRINELKNFSREIRIETIKQIGLRGFGHIGGAMSIVDLLSVLYGEVMKYDSNNPNWSERDWLVCSKGHAGPAIYSALALKKYFPMEWLETLNQENTMLPSHCDKNKTPGIDITTGSLGQGLSVASGVALGHKLKEKKNNVYCILGDGELQEGQNWEAVMFGAHNKLNNLIVFVDNNGKQLDDCTSNINNINDIGAKFKSFSWNVFNVDGHNHNEIFEAIENAQKSKLLPSVIILNTIKGKGMKLAEENWCHHMTISEEQVVKALCDLENK